MTQNQRNSDCVSALATSPLFTVPEASAYLKIPDTTLLLHLRRGTFSYKKCGKRYLIPRAEIEKFATTGFTRQGVR